MERRMMKKRMRQPAIVEGIAFFRTVSDIGSTHIRGALKCFGTETSHRPESSVNFSVVKLERIKTNSSSSALFSNSRRPDTVRNTETAEDVAETSVARARDCGALPPVQWSQLVTRVQAGTYYLVAAQLGVHYQSDLVLERDHRASLRSIKLARFRI